jgi:hypothetical protein
MIDRSHNRPKIAAGVAWHAAQRDLWTAHLSSRSGLGGVELRLEDVLVAGVPRTGADYLCQSGDMARVGGGNDVPGH